MDDVGPSRPAGNRRLHFRYNPDAAQHLKDELEQKAERLRDFPGLFRSGRVPGTREMVAHANYVVIYAEDDSGVRILRVLHAAQQWPVGD